MSDSSALARRWRVLLDGDDVAYAEACARAGKALRREKGSVHSYRKQSEQFAATLLDRTATTHRDVSEQAATTSALTRVLLLDAALVFDGYLDDEKAQARSERDEAATLYQSAVALAGSLTDDRLLERVLERAVAHSGASAAVAVTWSDSEQAFGPIHGIGLASSTLPALAFPADRQTDAALAEPGSLLLSGELPAARFALDLEAHHAGFEASVHIAVQDGTNTTAVLCVFFGDASKLDPRRHALLARFGQLAGLVLGNARTHGEAVSMASTDPLTGLANRRFLAEGLSRECQRARGLSKPFSVLALDIDHFKLINDQHGHPAGDAVLVQLTSVLLGQLREIDLAARVGGEEFVVVLPECDADGAREAAGRVSHAIATSPFELPTGGSIRLTISAGIATFPLSAANADGLLECADLALYDAKRRGRKRNSHFHDLLAAQLEVDPGSLRQLLSDHRGYVLPVLAAIEARAPSLVDHSVRVADISRAIGQELGLAREVLGRLEQAALLHDVGLAGVSADLLDDDSEAHDGDWERFGQHAVVGADILSEVDGLEDLAPTVRHHHERFDGTGFPDRLAANTIPLQARIVAVADNYVALTDSFPGREGLDRASAVAILHGQSGKSFDPVVITALSQALARDSQRPGRRGRWIDKILQPILPTLPSRFSAS